MNDTTSDPLDAEAIKAKLESLKIEHRDLDEVIDRLIEKPPFDQLQLQRLKKRKLGLKDQILRFESELLPDLIILMTSLIFLSKELLFFLLYLVPLILNFMKYAILLIIIISANGLTIVVFARQEYNILNFLVSHNIVNFDFKSQRYQEIIFNGLQS